MASKKYDIIIIGGGSAGLGALGMAQEFGWNPLIIDRDESHIGGDCLNFGCVPSKALIYLGKQFHGAKKAAKYGLEVSGKADMKAILGFVHDKQEVIRAHESADYIRAQGVDLEIGTASFENENTIRVGDNLFTSDRIILATGSRPRHIPFKGLDQVEKVFTNENIFYDMTELPDRFLVIGGGPIGCEMGQVFSRFGSKVTILNRGERLLGKEREEVSLILQEQFKAEGIEVINKASLTGFENSNTAIAEINGANKNFEFDAVLISVGRVLNLCAGMYQFSHGAEKHIALMKHNFKNSFNKKHDIKNLSWVTFTDPEVATFGFQEEELHKRNIKYWRQDQSFEKDDRAIVGEYTYGKITLFLTEKTFWNSERKILGGTIISPNAGEIMQELLLALNEELSISSIFNKLYPYPTQSRINQQTIMGVIKNDAKA